MQEMIKLENVTKVYKTGVRAVNDMSLTIDAGEFVYVIGPTGAGKSTFIKLLYREEKATRGKVIVDGTDVSRIKNSKVPYFRRRIGVVFQNYRLLPKKTVFENVAFALEVTNTPKTEIRKKVRNVLELVGLEDKANSFPHELSGGQQQRVAIARAIAYNPEVVLFDEPTSALDPRLTSEVLDVMRKLAEEGSTMVVVTHEMDFARKVANWVVYMEDGVIVEEGPSKEFFSQPKSEKTMAFLHMTSSDYVI